MVYKGRSKVLATYSKRKQFVRIIRDNWQEAERNSRENVFDIPKPLTSTPIAKAKPDADDDWCRDSNNIKPLNLLQSGSFDSPTEGTYCQLSHPRQLAGKRACRKPPALLNISPDTSTADSQLDLFAESSHTSTKSPPKCELTPPATPPSLESHVTNNCQRSDKQHPTELSLRHPLKSANGSMSMSYFAMSNNFSSQIEKTDLPEPANNELLFNNCSTREEISMSEVKENIEPDGDSIMEISTSNNQSSAVLSDILSDKVVEIEHELSKMSVHEAEVSAQMSALEMSIQECITENQICEVDRSLLLATNVPSYTKLLSQCRRVDTLQLLLQSELPWLRKIGEGSFGEVFMGSETVYKIVPVGGETEINDVEQTSFENAFQEIVVSRKLSDLAGDEVQMGKAFCQLKDVIFCRGKYPPFLLNAWDNFKDPENDRPDTLPEDQMYVVLLSKYSGVQLEDYCAEHNMTPDQAHSIVRQIICSLAAAEQKYEFEHRDLHWGNVLLVETATKNVEFTQDGSTFILKSHGLLATVIDFTFSRLETDGCLNFVDLEQEDWIFGGDVKVDIQYRVYRDMRSACRKNWAKFTPKTNVLWILYLIDKMNIKIKSPKLKRLRGLLQSCKSAGAALPLAFRSL